MHIPHFLVNLAETMDDWDQEKLEKVVESKGMEYSNNKPTEIVRFFFQFCFLLCVSCFSILKCIACPGKQLYLVSMCIAMWEYVSAGTLGMTEVHTSKETGF